MHLGYTSGMIGMQSKWFTQAFDYWVDASQRWILVSEVMRKRGNNYLAHLRAGQPPVLTFDYEMVLDGRTLPSPVNYALLRIVDRRANEGSRRHSQAPDPEVPAPATRVDPDRRECPVQRRADPNDPKKRPIVIIDPRAGHGPGIGGTKQDSQVGMALDQGHPVYFVIFYPAPVAGQTLADVQQAQTAFVRRVTELHPEAPRPAVIGNCQAGWAAALLAADRPELTGPLVLNGSPLSYWAGVAGKNPLRYRGGLLGGIWLVSFLGDLGGGRFDGAHLVAGFEDLNPSNTHWSKFYHVYANVDTEEKRYLEFERWWTGFFDMTSDEIHFILRNLFIGNRLQDGEVELDDRKIDLRNLTEPVVIFSSSGDNITPPQQALNWILRVWDSVEEIQRQKQTIVYLLHEEIGHLGIFVSGKIANKEHKQIIGNLQGIDLLPPGLYEMLIEPGDKHFKVNDYNVRFEKRDFEDIRALGDADGGGEEAFGPVAVISDFNDRLYRTFVRPWVRALTTGFSAEVFRQLHPLRVSRYMSSDWNPLSLPVQFLAGEIKKNRRGVRPDNPFLKAERMAADGVASLLDAYRDGRDGFHEGLFRLLYENPSVQALFSGGVSRAEVRSEGLQGQATTWPEGSDVGGFAEAAVRVMVALADARQVIHASHLETYGRLVERHPRLSELNPSFRETMKAQAGILRADPRRALAALGNLVTSRDDRSELVDLAEQIAAAHPPILEEERRVLEEIRRAVNLEERRPPHVPDAS